MNGSVERWVGYVGLLLAALGGSLFILSPPPANGYPGTCHVVDGAFTSCPGGPAEWSETTPDVFLDRGSHVYADQDGTNLYLLYDYVLRTCSGAADLCATLEFDTAAGDGRLDRYQISLGAACSRGPFGVVVNGVELPAGDGDLGIQGRAACASSPNESAAHQIYEVSVPLGTVYPYDDPRFWTAFFPAPPLPPSNDFDGDGVANGQDNCRFTPNPNQEDTAQDGRGDVCDCGAADSDEDGVPDEADNCLAVANPEQLDTDQDGAGDVCDSCPADEQGVCDPPNDSDGDGVTDGTDDCPDMTDPEQVDSDGDTLGNPCDPCPHDSEQACLCGPPGRGNAPSARAATERDADGSETVQGQAALITAGSDGTTTTDPRLLCASPLNCAAYEPNAIPGPGPLKKLLEASLQKRLNCIRTGTSPCDLSSLDEIRRVPLTGTACRAVVDCLLEISMELMFGERNPPPTPGAVLTDRCAEKIGKAGSKYLRIQLRNHIGGEDDKNARAASRAKTLIAGKCADPLNPPTSLGLDCAGDASTSREAALNCLFQAFQGVLPLR